MKKQNLKKLSLDQLDKMFTSLPHNNPFRDLVAAEIESRVNSGDDDDSDEQDDQAEIEKALQTLFDFDDEYSLEKAEGSRGGNIIGHTKSGHPIYGRPAEKAKKPKPGSFKSSEEDINDHLETKLHPHLEGLGIKVTSGDDVTTLKTKSRKKYEIYGDEDVMASMRKYHAAMKEHGGKLSYSHDEETGQHHVSFK
ncbi:MAG: hypothetical protein JHC54_11995 [Acinetobacter sp.]|nr:hypothetical protein [Acinetobacter sp.]